MASIAETDGKEIRLSMTREEAEIIHWCLDEVTNADDDETAEDIRCRVITSESKRSTLGQLLATIGSKV